MITLVRYLTLVVLVILGCLWATAQYIPTGGSGLTNVTALPATCSPTMGAPVYLTTGSTGIYVCVATNSWQLMGSNIPPPLLFTPPNLPLWSTQTAVYTPATAVTPTYTAGVSGNIVLSKANSTRFSQLWYQTQTAYTTFSLTAAVQISSDQSTNGQVRFIVASDSTFTGTPRFVALKCNAGNWGIYADLASETIFSTGVNCLVPTLFVFRVYDDGTKLHLQMSGDFGTNWIDLVNENRAFTIGAYGIVTYQGSSQNDTGIALWTVYKTTT